MRIAIINQPRDVLVASAAQRGSVSIVSWELAQRLGVRHDVTLYAPRAPGQTLAERGGHASIRRIPGVFRRLHRALDHVTGMLGFDPPYFTRDIFFAEYASAVARWLSRDPPHIVHLQICSQFLPTLREAVPNARIVFHTHDVQLTCIDRRMMEQRLALADAIVTCSDFVTRAWQERFPAHAHRISTIGNGVDLNVFQPRRIGVPAPEREILFLGRVSPEKGVHVLAAAFERVLDRVPDAWLSIIGPPGLLPFSSVRLLSDDEHGASLRRFYGHGFAGQVWRQIVRAKRGYLSDILSSLSSRARARVSIAGAQGYREVPEIYRRASVLAAPSVLPEPFGLPLAEALATGLPVVASRAGGMPEIVDDGITGRLVERNDVEGLANALCEILSDDSLAARMRQAARQVAVERLGWERAAARLEEVYERATASRPAIATHTPPTAPERVTTGAKRAAHT